MVKQQYLLHMSLQYGKLWPTNGWDRFGSFGAPQQISVGFLCWLRYCIDVAYRRPTKLCTMFGCVLDWYIFVGSCSLTEFCQVQNSLCIQVLPCSILAALLNSTLQRASAKLWRGTRNRITELLQRVTLIFYWGPSHWALAHIVVFVISLMQLHH